MEAKKRAAKTARISLFNIQRPNQTLQRDSSPPLFHFLTGYFFWSDLDTQNLIFVFIFSQTWNMKAKQRERKVTKSVYTSPIHTHNTHGDTTPTHGYTKPSNFTPTHRPISQFSLTKKIDTFNSFPNSICVNSHLHTHVHKITSTHIHTPIYNSHAA